MEFYPICDENFSLNSKIWYILSGTGELPLMRVGHTIVHVKTTDDDRGKLYLIGGANPSECFDDSYSFDLSTLKWTKLKSLGQPRYEHSCFIDNQFNPNKIFIFGGATQEENLNNILTYDLKTQDKWIELKNFKGNKPIPRTAHVGCWFKNQLVVFSGGNSQSLPVSDQQVHLFNPVLNTWTQPNIKGQIPSSRHGHLLLNFNDKCIYLHGGMNSNKFYNDLWKLDLNANTWSCIKQSQKDIPCARAAHGGISTNVYLYIFGGLNENAVALGDFWCFEVEKNNWSPVQISGDNPTPRLDFAYCKVSIKMHKVQSVFKASSEDQEENNSSNQKSIISVFDAIDSQETSSNSSNIKYVLNNSTISSNNDESTSTTQDCLDLKLQNINLNNNESNIVNEEEEFNECLVINGGMDTEGNVYDDCFIISLE